MRDTAVSDRREQSDTDSRFLLCNAMCPNVIMSFIHLIGQLNSADPNPDINFGCNVKLGGWLSLPGKHTYQKHESSIKCCRTWGHPGKFHEKWRRWDVCQISALEANILTCPLTSTRPKPWNPPDLGNHWKTFFYRITSLTAIRDTIVSRLPLAARFACNPLSHLGFYYSSPGESSYQQDESLQPSVSEYSARYSGAHLTASPVRIWARNDLYVSGMFFF